MAMFKLDKMFQGLQGRLGDLVFHAAPEGEDMFQRKENNSSLMREADAYARAALEDPELSVRYEQEAARLNTSAYSLAVSDYCKFYGKEKS